jgi:hypothetical protein
MPRRVAEILNEEPEMDNKNRRPGEVWIKNLEVGAQFRLNLGKGVSRIGTVVDQSQGSTTVRFEAASNIEKVLGEGDSARTLTISPDTAVVEI